MNEEQQQGPCLVCGTDRTDVDRLYRQAAATIRETCRVARMYAARSCSNADFDKQLDHAEQVAKIFAND